MHTHTHTHAAQFMYIKFPFLLLNASCSMKAHVLKVWVVDGLLRSDWTVGLSIIRELAHWWWNGLLDLAGESRSMLRALGAYLASLLSLCVFVSAFPFPSAIRWASLFSRLLCRGTPLYRAIPNPAARWPWTDTCETMSPNQPHLPCGSFEIL